MKANRLLGAGLFTLAALIVGYAVLGPLILDVIHFRTSVSGLSQVRGGDLAALVIVVPVCGGRRARLAGPPGRAGARARPGVLRDVHLLPAHPG